MMQTFPAFPVSGGGIVSMVTWILLLMLSAPTFAEKTPCKVCRDLTTSFKKHFDETIGHNFGGGNTAWEEKSLGIYATSETRLVEILERTSKACDYKCGSLLEDQEEYLEDWFFKRQDKTDLFEEMCLDHIKKCCLQNRWGAECWECPGGTENPCSGHGSCHGEGEREASSKKLHGTCTCDKGYTGDLCEECKSRFIKVGDTCEECSSLCDGQCVAPGAEGCEKCIKGYELLEDSGCTDINECEAEGCGDPLEDCVNSDGSYECVCKSGYTRVAGKCQLEELYANEDEDDDTNSETVETQNEDTKTETVETQDEDTKTETTKTQDADDEYEEVIDEIDDDNMSEDIEPQIHSLKNDEL